MATNPSKEIGYFTGCVIKIQSFARMIIIRQKYRRANFDKVCKNPLERKPDHPKHPAMLQQYYQDTSTMWSPCTNVVENEKLSRERENFFLHEDDRYLKNYYKKPTFKQFKQNYHKRITDEKIKNDSIRLQKLDLHRQLHQTYGRISQNSTMTSISPQSKTSKSSRFSRTTKSDNNNHVQLLPVKVSSQKRLLYQIIVSRIVKEDDTINEEWDDNTNKCYTEFIRTQSLPLDLTFRQIVKLFVRSNEYNNQSSSPIIKEIPNQHLENLRRNNLKPYMSEEDLKNYNQMITNEDINNINEILYHERCNTRVEHLIMKRNEELSRQIESSKQISSKDTQSPKTNEDTSIEPIQPIDSNINTSQQKQPKTSATSRPKTKNIKKSPYAVPVIVLHKIKKSH